MQHIVEVAFDYNDKAITEYIENQLEKDVRDGVTSKAWKEFRDRVPHMTYDKDGDFMEYMDIVREQDMERVKAFTSRKRAVRYLYSWGYHPKVETDMFEIWGRDYNQPERGFFRAYLEEKELVGAEHNYKYECKQLRATVRYLHRKIDKLQNQVALLRALCDVYLKEDL